MTGARFIKMQGLGNDFVVFDGRTAPVDLDPARLRAIADRRSGVGCDQIIVIGSATDGADQRPNRAQGPVAPTASEIQ